MTVVVVGGGLAGGAVATRLAERGCDVTLVEREAEPADKVCGEFLSAEAVGYLDALGVDVRSHRAQRLDAVRLSDGDRVASVELPFEAWSLSRRLVDAALLERAERSGARVLRGRRALGVARAADGWDVRLDGGERLDARAVFLANGKHDLRGRRRPRGTQNDLVAFKLHYALAPTQRRALDRHVELMMYAGGYAGLQPVEDGWANLCLVVRRRKLKDTGARWPSLLRSLRSESGLLDRRLEGAKPRWERPLALSVIPYGHVREHADGLWRLGDQAAVIPSFCGDGMSIALHSAAVASEIFLAGGTAEQFQRRLADDVGGQVSLATLISRGMVVRPVQRVLGLVSRAWPGIMSSVAFHTRVREEAMARVQLGSPA